MGIYKVGHKIGKVPKALSGLLKYVFGEDKKSIQEGIQKTTKENIIVIGEYNRYKVDAANVVNVNEYLSQVLANI